MTIKELRDYLVIKKIPKDMYSLDGGLPSEAFCIEKLANNWHFYYSERGEKNTIGYYETEQEVVNAFMTELSKYS